ncbi:MAG: 5-methylcytosine-specific restriction endonuclease system specificity protein McrC [Chloroflexi bacterium]|nr:5-methylcytosine-specific restriction endonuclease system specificity protein McrC [Chloroflexota bacterium]
MVGTVTSGNLRIPVRNIWLLMLYASHLFRQLDQQQRVAVEENPDDIADLIAEILTHEVQRRLARNLSFGWRTQQAEIDRVRGRIDLRRTETRRLLEKGKVACRFEELTIDTPRNRLVLAALSRLAGLVQRGELAHRCRSLVGRFSRLGVLNEAPSRNEVSVISFGHFDAGDRRMVYAAKLALDLALPNEDSGNVLLPEPFRGIEWLRGLFEKGVAGFYDVTLSPDGWQVSHGKTIRWPMDNPTPGIGNILPSMKTDILLNHPALQRRIIIDTKFNSILSPGRYRPESLRSDYLYQLYSYLKTQEAPDDPLSLTSIGVLMHPAISKAVDEAMVVQGHLIRFATVDLSADAGSIRLNLLALVEPHPYCA